MDAVRKTITYTAPETGKAYRLADEGKQKNDTKKKNRPATP
jgi:hypothetical protein